MDLRIPTKVTWGEVLSTMDLMKFRLRRAPQG
jgi:hypothetical protein